MNAPSSFQMLMSQVFRGISFKYLIAYIDDLLIFSPNFETHLEHLQNVFERLRSARLRLHPKKCNFAVHKVMYLGHQLSKDGASVDEAKIDVVRKYPTPKVCQGCESFSRVHRILQEVLSQLRKNRSTFAPPIGKRQRIPMDGRL